MDLNKIFGLFNDQEPESLKGKSQLIDDVLDFKEHPLFWVGMFKKLIQNHIFFVDQFSVSVLFQLIIYLFQFCNYQMV